ncbi:hypothetical protein LCGC14_0195990 [marine sediment metagenome]|uniref:Uncharacterized protein n=1 Tax=marine sediment metagenome TaxID=412755 RepID=A0A0F9X4M5_9ZZZZ
MKCENRHDQLNNILPAKCLAGEQKRIVTVDYGYEKDELKLCVKCAGAVKRDAEKHGYTVTVAELKKEARYDVTNQGDYYDRMDSIRREDAFDE